MSSDGLTAFSGAVIAVLITIKDLELKARPAPPFHDLAALWPVFAS